MVRCDLACVKCGASSEKIVVTVAATVAIVIATTTVVVVVTTATCFMERKISRLISDFINVAAIVMSVKQHVVDCMEIFNYFKSMVKRTELTLLLALHM